VSPLRLQRNFVDDRFRARIVGAVRHVFVFTRVGNVGARVDNVVELRVRGLDARARKTQQTSPSVRHVDVFVCDGIFDIGTAFADILWRNYCVRRIAGIIQAPLPQLPLRQLRTSSARGAIQNFQNSWRRPRWRERHLLLLALLLVERVYLEKLHGIRFLGIHQNASAAILRVLGAPHAPFGSRLEIRFVTNESSLDF
jgi:hypothetical protein